MVVSGQDSFATIEDNIENEPEDKNSDTQTNEKVKLKTETDLPPTELERLKTFTQKVARCAAKSFCETYVRPLVIKNPHPLPTKSETMNIQNQEDQSATIINPAEDQAKLILNPDQERKEKQVSSSQNQRREIEEESYRQTALLNPNKTKKDPIAATVNLLQEKEMVILDKGKPSLSFDIANILSYIPCKSLFASCDEKDENNEEALNLESKASELSGHFDINCRGSQSSTYQETKGNEEIDKETVEEASPFTEDQ